MASTEPPTNGYYEGTTYNSNYFNSLDDVATSSTIYISTVPTDPTFDSVTTGTLEITTSGTSITNTDAGDSSTQIATDEFVQNAITNYATNNPSTQTITFYSHTFIYILSSGTNIFTQSDVVVGLSSSTLMLSAQVLSLSTAPLIESQICTFNNVDNTCIWNLNIDLTASADASYIFVFAYVFQVS